MAQLIEGKFALADDEAIGFLNSAAGTAFDQATHEVESVEVVVGEDGERSLIVVVGIKG